MYNCIHIHRRRGEFLIFTKGRAYKHKMLPRRYVDYIQNSNFIEITPIAWNGTFHRVLHTFYYLLSTIYYLLMIY